MPAISLSKLASNFVGRFFAIGPNVQDFVVRYDLLRPADLPVFRVVDDRTRQASLQPARAGVIVFNLLSKRIVQIHNTYTEIKRSGRIRFARSEGSATRVHRYQLPPDWSLVPSA